MNMTTKTVKAPSKTVLRAHVKDEIVNCVLSATRSISSNDQPSPLELDKFLPWVCMQFNIFVEVTVKIIEKYVSRRRPSNETKVTKFKATEKKPEPEPVNLGKQKSTERKPVSQMTITLSVKRPVSTHPSFGRNKYIPEEEGKIPITAYYSPSGNLVELAIAGSPIKIQPKAIKCISLCLPYHPKLCKFTITKGGISCDVLYELSKLLPLYNITDVCLDNSYVKEGNYYVLLDNLSSLRALSLRRCRINDTVCKELAARMGFGKPASRLTVLDLGSNLISDAGVWFLADILRMNRSLMHLCLSSNQITDTGCKYIMNHLQVFPMTGEEILAMKKRRLEFGIKQMAKMKKVQEQQLESVGTQMSQSNMRSRNIPGKAKSPRKKKPSALKLELSKPSMLKLDFVDVFDEGNTLIRDGYMHCVGNLTLCSLNLAYNDLDFVSVKKIFEVLLYQEKACKKTGKTGLVRLVLDGNRIPEDCDELNEIRLHFNLVTTGSQRVLRSKTSLLKKGTNHLQF